jgi:DNA processing protein
MVKKITINDENYPEILKNIPNPPKQLYILGNENLLKEKNVAIIGSRVCTPEGAKIAEEFARELSKNGICIVSGMAQGIDTAAHVGALKAGGKTIAVLGGGFNHIFPKENESAENPPPNTAYTTM